MNKIIYAFFALMMLATTCPSRADTLQNELVYRVSLGRADDVKLLLDQGASANLTNEDGVPVLALAASRRDAEGQNVLNALIKAGANVNATDKNGQTALFYAAKEGNKDAVNTLLNNNINYYAIDAHGDIARTIAFKNGHQDIVDSMDSFVKGQTKKVTQQYEDVNNELKKRYQKEQEETQKAADDQKKLDEAANPALQNGAATPTNTKSAISSADEIAAKRQSSEFKKDMHDYAFQNCAYQYWYFVQQAKQSTELSPDELDIAANSHMDDIEQQGKHVMDTYELDRNYMSNISTNAKQRIFYDLSIMPSNTYRHEQGVGKMDDMKDRCEHIANSWTEKAQPLPSKKADQGDSREDKSAGGKHGGKHGGISGGGQGGSGNIKISGSRVNRKNNNNNGGQAPAAGTPPLSNVGGSSVSGRPPFNPFSQ